MTASKLLASEPVSEDVTSSVSQSRVLAKTLLSFRAAGVDRFLVLKLLFLFLVAEEVSCWFSARFWCSSFRTYSWSVKMNDLMSRASDNPMMPDIPQPSSRTAEFVSRMPVLKRMLVWDEIHEAKRGVIFQTTWDGEYEEVRAGRRSKRTSTRSPATAIWREECWGLVDREITVIDSQL